MHTDIVLHITKQLQSRSNKDFARAMAAYMKTNMPFYGVKTPERRAIVKDALKLYPIKNQHEYNAIVNALWVLAHREEKHSAIEVARLYPHYINLQTLPLFERMIREGAWWDFVDESSIRLVGTLLRKDPAALWPIIDTWISSECMWIRRSAIICQNTFRKQTDHERLFSFCLQRAHEKEFFIRKAIGWALREYAKTEPERVKNFLIKHKHVLSNLSYREASKHLAM